MKSIAKNTNIFKNPVFQNKKKKSFDNSEKETEF